MLVDSHCHINFEALHTNLADILEHARASGVSHMLCVAVNLTDYPQVKRLADTYDHIFASVGVHPNERPSAEPSIEELLALADDPRHGSVHSRLRTEPGGEHARFDRNGDAGPHER